MSETEHLGDVQQNITFAFCKKSQFDFFNDQGYPFTTLYYSGKHNNASFLTWQGLDKNMSFVLMFDKLFKSSLGKIQLNDTSSAQVNNAYHHFDQHLPKFKAPGSHEKIIIPYGKCKVFSGKPIRYLEFLLKDDGLPDAYHVLISDSAANNYFQEFFYCEHFPALVVPEAFLF